ncbi:MAG: VCBS repeat-containing protein [Polyangiaceae bacterium]
MKGLGSKLVVVALPWVLACGSNHHVSEWGEAGAPKLTMFVDSPDLEAHVDGMNRDADLAGFDVEDELHGSAAGTAYVVRLFRGPRLLGRDQRAIRVASPSGVILALGPIDPRSTVRTEPDDLVRAFDPKGDGETVFRSMTDLTGDGTLDLVVRSESGELAVYSLGPRGATRLEVTMAAPPVEGVDVDGDGRMDLRGSVPIADDDPIAPDLSDVATFDGRQFSNATAGAKAFHSDQADAVAVDAPAMAGTVIGLRRSLERAWHTILRGGDRKEALEALDKARPDVSLRASFDAHRARITAL